MFPQALANAASRGVSGSLLCRPRRKPFWLAQPAAQRNDVTFRGFTLPALPAAARRSGLIPAFVTLAPPHFTLRAREGFKPDNRHTKPRWTTEWKEDLPASQSIAKRGKGFSLPGRRRRRYFFAGGRGDALSSLTNYRAPNRPPAPYQPDTGHPVSPRPAFLRKSPMIPRNFDQPRAKIFSYASRPGLPRRSWLRTSFLKIARITPIVGETLSNTFPPVVRTSG